MGKGMGDGGEHIGALVGGRALFCKNHGDIIQKMRRGQRQGDAAGFHCEHDIRLVLAEIIGQLAAHRKHQAGVEPVVQKHVYLDDAVSHALTLTKDGFTKLPHAAPPD